MLGDPVLLRAFGLVAGRIRLLPRAAGGYTDPGGFAAAEKEIGGSKLLSFAYPVLHRAWVARLDAIQVAIVRGWFVCGQNCSPAHAGGSSLRRTADAGIGGNATRGIQHEFVGRSSVRPNTSCGGSWQPELSDFRMAWTLEDPARSRRWWGSVGRGCAADRHRTRRRTSPVDQTRIAPFPCSVALPAC